jgi:nucleotide-binding universal stress UspA family protein
MIEKILVAIDGSEASLHALDQAVHLASLSNAQMLILSVVPPISPLAYMGPAPLYIDQYFKAARESHQRVLDDSSAKAKNKHSEMEVETRLEEGRPAEVICKIAENEDVDLIVMGSQGMGGISGWVLGSTSRSVVDSCTKPILIVK